MKHLIILVLAILAFNTNASEPEPREAIKSMPAILSLLLADECAQYKPRPPVEGEPPISIDPPKECGGKDWSKS